MADKLTNSLVAKAKKENDLSPNPSGFGFTKQVKVDSLPVSGQEFDTLYYLPDGRAFRWFKEHKWERVLNDGQPSVKSKNGQAAPNTKVETPATPAFAKIINGNVAVNGRLLVNGKDVETDDTEEEIIKVIDTVNEGLVDGTINVIANGEGTASTPLAKLKVGENIYDVLDLEKLAGVEAGSAASLLGVDSSGNVIKGDVPVGSVIDDNVTSDGINPVKGSGIYSFVEGIVAEEYDSTDTYNTGDYCLYQGGLYIAKADSVTGSWDSSKWDLVAISEKLKELKEEVDKKADTTALEDGGIVPAKSLTSKQLENVSEDSGSTQDAPFVFQATATDGGAGASDTAPTAKYLKLKGKTYALNQWVQNGNFETTNFWESVGANGSLSASGNVLTYTATSIGANDYSNQVRQNISAKVIIGHKYLIKGYIKSSKAFPLQVGMTNATSISRNNGEAGTANTWNLCYAIVEPTGTISSYSHFVQLGFDMRTGEVGDTYEVKDVQCFDLTQLFNENIPTEILNGVTLSDYGLTFTGVDLFNQLFPLPYYAYNAGTPVSANATLLTTYGKNQFDYEHPTDFINVVNSQKYIIENANGGTLTEYDGAKNEIGTTSIDSASKVVTLSSNTHYVKISGYTSTTCFYLYWDGTRTGFEKYVKHEYPLGSELATSPLLSAGDVCDEKTPDGTITRRVGVVDLGTRTWVYDSSGRRFISYDRPTGIKRTTDQTIKQNLLSSHFISIRQDQCNGNVSNKVISTYDGYLYVVDKDYTDAAAFKTAMSGVYLYYEIATPTTEVGTPFAAIAEVDDFGTMEYGGNSYNGYPQGCEFFYPADYVLFIDSLGNACDFDPSKIALKSDVSAEETARTGQDTILQNAIGGTLRQCLCVKESLNFDDTEVIDLGTLTYTYVASWNGYNLFYCELPSMEFDLNVIKALCTKYQAATGTSYADKRLFVNSGSVSSSVATIGITDSSYSDATSFKAAMKGVLLAYKKASE